MILELKYWKDLWKVLWDLLPTKAKIAERVGLIDEDSMICGLCGFRRETIYHMVLELCFAQVLWRESKWPTDTVNLGFTNVVEWVNFILDPLDVLVILIEEKHQFQLFARCTSNRHAMDE